MQSHMQAAIRPEPSTLCMYMYLEVVNGDKVRKEWENILNLENTAVLEELHCPVVEHVYMCVCSQGEHTDTGINSLTYTLIMYL